MFNCAFMELDFDYRDVRDLFGVLDTQNRGYIDQEAFEQLFIGNVGQWNSLQHDIMASVVRNKDPH